ncbi:hypothetical protein L7F22_023981 [Adiantum nelumboides]|nr:hypothetical protein [Adiantum nelumboides]
MGDIGTGSNSLLQQLQAKHVNNNKVGTSVADVMGGSPSLPPKFIQSSSRPSQDAGSPSSLPQSTQRSKIMEAADQSATMEAAGQSKSMEDAGKSRTMQVLKSNLSLSRGQGRAKNTVETCSSAEGMETKGLSKSNSGKRLLSNTVQHSKGKKTRGSGTRDHSYKGHSGISQLQWYEDPECRKVKLEPSDDLVSLL